MTLDMLDAPAGFIDRSHPERAEEAGDLLVGYARQIRAWQEGQRSPLSDAQMVRTFPGLGSDKTYRKLREGDLSSLNTETHLPKYRGVWAQIEAMAGAAAAEEYYDDMQPALDAAAAVAGLIPQRGMARLVVIVGPTGSGKTVASRIAARKFPGLVVLTEAHEGWASLNCALGDMLLALDAVKSADDFPASAGERLSKVIAALKGSRRVLWIDEAHHATPAVLNAIKTILNQTESLVVLGCIDTLWRKLAARSWDEVQQLFYNRLFEMVKLTPPSKQDTIDFLARRCAKLTGASWHGQAGRVAEMAAGRGRFAFLRELTVRLGEIGSDGSDLVTIATNLKLSLEIR
jgi:DNA transposition AAA+ family ATPase